MVRWPVCFGIVALVSVLVAGCPKPQQPAPPADTTPVLDAQAGQPGEKVSLKVMVPCGLAGPYGELRDIFAVERPDIELHERVDNTFVMARDVAEGEDEADVMLCLGDREAAYLQEHEKVLGEPVPYAGNAIAILVPKGNPQGLQTLEDLAKPEVESLGIATGDINSLGFYAQQAFERAGLWEQVEPKCWRPDEPIKIGHQVATGKLDAGIVYATCLQETRTVGGKPTPRTKTEGVARVDQKHYDRILCEGIKLVGCADEEAADAFLAFVAKPEHDDLWARWGFDPLEQPEESDT